ncbi:MAG: hypothetical protein HFF60_09540 [Oscillospiraceae bacterium]|nr:hypothetical protein [Oscillospiraceae bacterium]
MLYKDFRDVYISQKEVEIINLEQNAYENYMTAKFSLDEAHLTNGLTNLWIKRTINGNYYYKRTPESQYSEVSSEVYKDNICLIIAPTSSTHFVNVYRKVFDEKPTFRSFTFLNYIEEGNLPPSADM